MPQAKCSQRHQYSISDREIKEGTKGCPTCGQHFHDNQLIESGKAEEKSATPEAKEQE